jgi:hypothetical protein
MSKVVVNDYFRVLVTEALQTGHRRKQFAATAMNERSSRSHTAFVIQVLQKRIQTYTQTQFKTEDHEASFAAAAAEGTEITSERVDNNISNSSVVKSQLHLVDLAGSERVKKSKVSGARLREAIGINSSLLVLGKVITALVENKSHVPYFESKLTTMLKSAFGGTILNLVFERNYY